jgi:Uma2 family endonuclease
MNVALRQPMSLDAFLAWEEAQEFKHEFDGIAPIAMTGVTNTHAFIQRNLTIKVGGPLLGKRCQFAGTDLKVRVGGSIRYPDGLVVCTPQPPGGTIAQDPVVIFEILSKSTSHTDLVIKNREYESVPSIRRYVILEQDRVGGTMFERIDGDWVGHMLRADAVLHMPEIGLAVPVADFYVDVVFPDRPEGTEP